MAQAEQCPSVEAAANEVRTDDITLPSAVRWLRRRLLPVRMALMALETMMPELFAGCAPTVTAMRMVLGTGRRLWRCARWGRCISASCRRRSDLVPAAKGGGGAGRANTKRAGPAFVGVVVVASEREFTRPEGGDDHG